MVERHRQDGHFEVRASSFYGEVAEDDHHVCLQRYQLAGLQIFRVMQIYGDTENAYFVW